MHTGHVDYVDNQLIKETAKYNGGQITKDMARMEGTILVRVDLCPEPVLLTSPSRKS